MYTREEFEKLRIDQSQKMYQDKGLKKDALNVLCQADKYHWIHQTTWQGEPVLQLPQDMFAVQEIILETKPDHIIEVGVAWGGSTLFYSSIMSIYGGKSIIGVDTYMPDDMVDRISNKNCGVEIIYIESSSLNNALLTEINARLESDKCMVILDSHHTHNHVLAELNKYSPLVGKGHYIICSDTIIEDMPELHRNREWDKGNSPRTALEEFLSKNKYFERDERIRNKLLISCHADGYLRRKACQE